LVFVRVLKASASGAGEATGVFTRFSNRFASAGVREIHQTFIFAGGLIG
jgi:hypothetical protein